MFRLICPGCFSDIWIDESQSIDIHTKRHQANCCVKNIWQINGLRASAGQCVADVLKFSDEVVVYYSFNVNYLCDPRNHVDIKEFTSPFGIRFCNLGTFRKFILPYVQFFLKDSVCKQKCHHTLCNQYCVVRHNSVGKRIKQLSSGPSFYRVVNSMNKRTGIVHSCAKHLDCDCIISNATRQGSGGDTVIDNSSNNNNKTATRQKVVNSNSEFPNVINFDRSSDNDTDSDNESDNSIPLTKISETSGLFKIKTFVKESDSVELERERKRHRYVTLWATTIRKVLDSVKRRKYSILMQWIKYYRDLKSQFIEERLTSGSFLNSVLAEDPKLYCLFDIKQRKLLEAIKEAELSRLKIERTLAEKEAEFKSKLEISSSEVVQCNLALNKQVAELESLKTAKATEIELLKKKNQSTIEKLLFDNKQYYDERLSVILKDTEMREKAYREIVADREKQSRIELMKLQSEEALRLHEIKRASDDLKSEEKRWKEKQQTTVYDVMKLTGSFPMVDGAEFSIEFVKNHKRSWGEFKKEQISSIVSKSASCSGGWSVGFGINLNNSYSSSWSWKEGNDHYSICEEEDSHNIRRCLKISGRLHNHHENWYLLYNPETVWYSLDKIEMPCHEFVYIGGNKQRSGKIKYAPYLINEEKVLVQTFDQKHIDVFLPKRVPGEFLKFHHHPDPLDQLSVIRVDNHPLLKRDF